jgi:hypothetical protein
MAPVLLYDKRSIKNYSSIAQPCVPIQVSIIVAAFLTFELLVGRFEGDSLPVVFSHSSMVAMAGARMSLVSYFVPLSLSVAARVNANF